MRILVAKLLLVACSRMLLLLRIYAERTPAIYDHHHNMFLSGKKKQKNKKRCSGV